MSSNTIMLMVYCAIGVLVIMLAICFNLVRMAKELERKVKDLSEDNDEHYKAELQLQNFFNRMDISLNQLRGSIEVLTASTGGDMHDIQRQLTRMETQLRKLQCDTAINGNRLHDIVEWTGMDHDEPEKVESAVEYWADKAVLADVVDPANLETPAEKEETNNEESGGVLVSYDWIFPGDDKIHGIDRTPVVGQWYLCVGTLKGLANDSGEPLIFTDEGLFNGKDFITSQDQRFDKVFAYIKKPSAVDIMKKVFSLAIEAKG